MGEEIRIKSNAETRRKLKILAAMMDKTMTEVLDILVDEALTKAQSNADTKSVQNKTKSNK